ncbi:hypothetical protein PPL_06248 [Heterostelium album PN500]|uniref:Transmembrane protein n=1 Tax=Heterostelium pallidum (strain ATCC 26659 / Pp 5 / PN500) TaxID=670386 RepID=D3BCM3_HETP5|nr:hypothetical protein PPL_06248 [Heterostelium album PN500]EFA80665.1 hypothetical protein PPL_06248 [Heterostelium album PN500]|eukprot:XP_020432785.1 hypothetical protein PPL_06248 [Heterostelium album PN500]
MLNFNWILPVFGGSDRYADQQKYTYFTSDLKLSKYPQGYCGGTPIESCDYEKYGEAVILTSGVTLIIAFTILIISIFFWLGRSTLFGGCHGSRGFFVPKGRFIEQFGEGYTNCQIFTLRVVVIILVGCSIPLFITCLHGNVKLTNGLKNIGKEICDKADETYKEVYNITQQLNSTEFERLEIYANITDKEILYQQVQNILQDAIGLKKDAHGINDRVIHYNTYRNSITLVVLIFALIACGVLAFSIFNIPQLAFMSAIIIIIILPLMWITFSVHYSSNFLISDLCQSYTINYGNGTVSQANFTNPLVNEVFNGCQNGSATMSVFDDLVTTVTGLLNSSYTEACGDGGFGSLCDLQFDDYPDGYQHPPVKRNVLDCSGLPACNNKTIELYTNVSIYDFEYGCYRGADPAECPFNAGNNAQQCLQSGGKLVTCHVKQLPSVKDCEAQCKNQDIANYSQTAVDGVDALLIFQGIWSNQVLPLISCANLVPFVKSIEYQLCEEEYDYVQQLVAPTCLFAILLIAVGIVSVLASKRFNKHNQRCHNEKKH